MRVRFFALPCRFSLSGRAEIEVGASRSDCALAALAKGLARGERRALLEMSRHRRHRRHHCLIGKSCTTIATLVSATCGPLARVAAVRYCRAGDRFSPFQLVARSHIKRSEASRRRRRRTCACVSLVSSTHSPRSCGDSCARQVAIGVQVASCDQNFRRRRRRKSNGWRPMSALLLFTFFKSARPTFLISSVNCEPPKDLSRN